MTNSEDTKFGDDVYIDGVRCYWKPDTRYGLGNYEAYWPLQRENEEADKLAKKEGNDD